MIDTRRITIPISLAFLVMMFVRCWGEGRDAASVIQKRQVFTLSNSFFSIEVDAKAGARIRSWHLNASGRDLIAFWKGANEIGGALDDRAYFTAAHYRAAIMNPGPDNGILRVEAIHPSGLKVIKILTIHPGEPVLDVNTRFENGTQSDQRVFVRNFFLPGTHPQTPDHLYWVNGKPERGKGGPVVADPGAHGYYFPLKLPFASLWDRQTGDGILALAPGWEKFYFWRGSKKFPTFEWLISSLPPGNALSSQVRLVTVSGQKTAPDWTAMARRYLKSVRTVSIRPLEGWIDEATKFKVTEAERARGFWVSMGRDEFKRRIEQEVRIDLPRESSRWISITLNVLRSFKAGVEIGIPGEWAGQVKAAWETPGKDRRELLAVPEGAWHFKSGFREHVWLEVSSTGKEAGEYTVPVRVRVGDVTAGLTLRLRVWPVRVESRRPFHVRGYCGGFPTLAGGYEITSQKLKRLDAILKTYAAIGGNVLDWNGAWYKVFKHVRLAGTNETVAEVVKNHPGQIDLDHLPKLDFSYYDPWFDLAKKYGVTRLETYMTPLAASRWQWVFLDPLVGKKRVKYNTPEANSVITWFYSEMKRELQERGFTGLFCKISDEISPDFIPAYQAGAKVARGAGWRPFTTITGLIARTAVNIQAMNPFCDEWQLSFGLKDDFLDRLDRKYRLVEKRADLKGKWGHYTNGGARGAWALKAFGQDSVTEFDPRAIEQLRVFEDGRPLLLLGGSPWGKKAPGTAYTAGSIGTHLYLIPSDGQHPDKHHYEVVASIRKEAPNGKPLAAIDPTDEVWCYGGSSRPFRRSYASTWVYPVMTLYHGFSGYGLWAFFHWNPTEKIMWIDDETCRVTISPPYCGYRDGWEDARLFYQVITGKGRGALKSLIGPEEGAAVSIGFRSREVYHFRTALNGADFRARNEARRRALALLSRPASPQ